MKHKHQAIDIDHKINLSNQVLILFFSFYFFYQIDYVCAQAQAQIKTEKNQKNTENTEKSKYQVEVKDKKQSNLSQLSSIRDTFKVSRQQIDELLPRSTPEALQLVPGVYVQQTAHGQASVYIRGRTGAHTILLFDGFRISHTLFRNGPNQYLFSVDPDSLQSIDVLRGSAGVDWGSNGLTGAIQANPLEVKLDPQFKGMTFKPLVLLRNSTSDKGYGLRSQLQGQLSQNFGFIAGVGYKKMGLLEASGPLKLENIPDGYPLFQKEVPRFQKDGRTQMGTGYSMLNADLRTRYRISAKEDLIIATYLTRQYDSPRTDQCPPPEAPDTWCLNYDEQFRTQIYSRLTLRPNQALIKRFWAGISFQRFHEKRTNHRDQYINAGRDDLNQYELRVRAQTKTAQIHSFKLKMRYGIDGSTEYVSSKAWDTIVRSQITRIRSRGQYLNDSSYHQAGFWVSPELRFRDLLFSVGGRQHITQANSPADDLSLTKPVDRLWLSKAFNIGLKWVISENWGIKISFDQGFRPPNLDDLTARQITGQGYQIENPDLKPEKSNTYEIGIDGVIGRFSTNLWLYYSTLRDLIEKRTVDCPPTETSCVSSRRATPFTFVNVEKDAYIYGFENVSAFRFPYGFTLSHQMSYAYGAGLSTIISEREQGKFRPLSRIPPFNGQLQFRWDKKQSETTSFYINAELRWATQQDRLSFGDEIDKRIPFGGTPGYQVYFLRFGIAQNNWSFNGIIENITDTPYRIHGSSINGAGRGFLISLRYAPVN